MGSHRWLNIIGVTQKYFYKITKIFQDAKAASQTYFKQIHSDTSSSPELYFLDTAEAAPFLAVFRNIRLPHLINHHMDVEMLVSDKIVPDAWMSSIYYTSWMKMLRLDGGVDK